jgi:uncharacterized protein (TIGR02246 family)
MKLRNLWIFFILVAVAACGGAAEEPAAETPAAAEPAAAPVDDGAALDEMTAYYATHYNMGHADMVAELFNEDAVFLAADGSVQDGKAAILASMETAMASSPTLSLDVSDRVISGSTAVSHGVWSLEMTPEGAPGPLALEGHFMTLATKESGEWKTNLVITNYHADPPEGTPVGEPPAEAPPELTDSPLSELATYYATHYSMGHGDMVASRYAENAVAAVANRPVAQGRAAIAADMNARIAEAGDSQLTIHEVMAQDMGDGWFVGAGWYEMATDAGDSSGAFVMLCRAGADGNMEIQWVVSNGQPVTE